MATDPNAIRTWANAITVSRLLVSPLMFAIIPDDNVGSWAATGLWFVLCLSDLIDGNLARRQGGTKHEFQLPLHPVWTAWPNSHY